MKKSNTDLLTKFPVFSKHCLKIQTKTGELIPFKLNSVQVLVQEILKDIRKNGRLIRTVILKARREGMSTYIAGRFFWRVTTSPNKYAMMVTHEPDATNFIFNMQKRFLAHMPEPLKPTDRYNNLRILEFNNQEGTGLDSAIRVGSAGKEDFGSAQLVHFLHISELSKWEGHIATPLLTSLFQTVPDAPFTEIHIESTAKGIGGEFHDRFWKSRYTYNIFLDAEGKPVFKCTVNPDVSESNEFSSIFVPWFVLPEYQKEPPEDFKRTDDEEELVGLYNLTDKHLAWRRWCIENQCNGNIEIFKQEYPSNPHEAFLVSGVSVFPTDKILRYIKQAPKVLTRYDTSITNRQLISKPEDGRLLVWDEPKADVAYIVSGDPAEGLEKGDFSSIDVIERLSGDQVAHWHGKIAPDLFGIICMVLGFRYNKAIISVERNNHGLTVINKLLDENYPNIYVEIVHEAPGMKRKRYGWQTTRKSKPLIIDNLLAEIRDGTHGIKCIETFKEMLHFRQHPNGKLEAEANMYDDRIMSIAIAKYIRTKLPLPQIRREQTQFSTFHSRRPTITKPVPTQAWV